MGARTLSEYVGVHLIKAKGLRQDHRNAFPDFWDWSARVQDSAKDSRVLSTVFGWRMKVLPKASAGSLMNYPMQANGSEMLRFACCHAVDAGIPIVAPVHDAIMVEGPANEIEDIAAAMRDCMVRASREVMAGPAVRVDTKIVRFPDRYVDGRAGSVELWDMTLRLLGRVENGR
jgi:DNA polymerase I-like protein with 3'-5' exonuclease and polymerase domains